MTVQKEISMKFQIDMDYLLDCFRQIVNTPSPVGYYAQLNPLLEKLTASFGCEITYDRRGDISRQNFIDLLPPVVRLAAKLIGFEGSYLRFEGSATIEKLEQGRMIESATENSAVWELMYFGKAGADKA